MIELFLAVLVGAVLNLLFSLNEIFGKPEFKWKIFIQQNILPTIINVTCGLVLVWFREDLGPSLQFGGLGAVFMGLGGQTLFKRIQNAFSSKVDTYIGVN